MENIYYNPGKYDDSGKLVDTEHYYSDSECTQQLDDNDETMTGFNSTDTDMMVFLKSNDVDCWGPQSGFNYSTDCYGEGISEWQCVAEPTTE